MDLESRGLPRVSLTRLVRQGRLERVGRGLYALPSREVSEHSALAEVARRHPRTLVCLLSALRFHELTTQAPHEVWIAIPNKARAPRLAYPPVRVARFAGATMLEGIDQHRIDGIPVRVTNVFVGACLGGGASNEVIAQCLRGAIVPLMGTALLAEYEDVLGREPLFERSRLNSAERDELLDIFLARCRWTRIYYGWRPNVPDEGDNHLVELAVAGGAWAIVTRNLRDLARMDLQFPAIRLMAPEDILREVRK